MDKDTLSVMELLPAFGRMQGEAWRGLPPKDAREVAALTTSQLKAVMLVAMRELSGGMPMTLGELADALALKKSATSILVTALEEQGLASRRADEENARKVRITLSRRGRSLAERVTTPASERVSAFLGTLGKVERTAFVSVARKFTAFVRGAAMCIALCAALAGCSESQNRQGEDGIVLHGNVDDREMQLAFVISERLEAVMPEEGETVKKDDIVAKCETVRLENDVAVAEATVKVREAELKAAEAILSKSENGSRKEDIAAVTALKSGIAAKLKAAKLTYERNRRLVETHAVSQQDADNAEAAYLFLSHAETTISNLLERLIAGDRMEDRASAAARKAAAEAALAEAKARLAVARRRVEDATLHAPADGIVRTRILEPGELTAPQNPVLTLALTDPKWVRCYVRETDLVRVKLGAKASVAADSRPEPFEGWVGYISPTAEFTPKNIETDELRPTLVYETRIYVKDPSGKLKLGAPVIVTL